MPSSVIKDIGYDLPARELRITFVSGKSYKYYGVPELVYERFRRAASKGAFFNASIKDRYDFAPLEAATTAPC